MHAMGQYQFAAFFYAPGHSLRKLYHWARKRGTLLETSISRCRKSFGIRKL
jgi:hypothetical protein